MPYRTPEELPNHMVLMYPSELAAPFLHVTEHIFHCQFSSLESSEKTYIILEDIDTTP